jgi:hypothetical protein
VDGIGGVGSTVVGRVWGWWKAGVARGAEWKVRCGEVQWVEGEGKE